MSFSSSLGSHSHAASISSSNSTSSWTSCRLGWAEIWPKRSGDCLRPTSAKWSALVLSICDGVCSHFTWQPAASVRLSSTSHRSLCWIGPFLLTHPCWRHFCAHPNIPPPPPLYKLRPTVSEVEDMEIASTSSAGSEGGGSSSGFSTDVSANPKRRRGRT